MNNKRSSTVILILNSGNLFYDRRTISPSCVIFNEILLLLYGNATVKFHDCCINSDSLNWAMVPETYDINYPQIIMCPLHY